MEAQIPSTYLDEDIAKEMVVLVVGQTGAGKSTQIDGMLNYLLGIKWEEDIRFKVVDELETVSKESLQAGSAASQTDAVTAYKIPAIKGGPVKSKLTIVDTPGFGDTRGLHFDHKIVDQMKKFFNGMSDHVSILTGVCFVAQASAARLTESQQYVWNAILGLFGKDIADNILLCFTFADGEKPQALEAVQAGGIPMKGSFKFNNSALFVDPSGPATDAVSKMFWDMGQRNMSEFFQSLACLDSKSLHLSKQVMEEREQLEVSLENLGPEVKLTLGIADSLQQQGAAVCALWWPAWRLQRLQAEGTGAKVSKDTHYKEHHHLYRVRQDLSHILPHLPMTPINRDAVSCGLAFAQCVPRNVIGPSIKICHTYWSGTRKSKRRPLMTWRQSTMKQTRGNLTRKRSCKVCCRTWIRVMRGWHSWLWGWRSAGKDWTKLQCVQTPYPMRSTCRWWSRTRRTTSNQDGKVGWLGWRGWKPKANWWKMRKIQNSPRNSSPKGLRMISQSSELLALGRRREAPHGWTGFHGTEIICPEIFAKVSLFAVFHLPGLWIASTSIRFDQIAACTICFRPQEPWLRPLCR